MFESDAHTTSPSCQTVRSPSPLIVHKIRYMKPLLDDKFVAYMGYAIQTEREAIEKRGLNPDREPSRWLQVLGVIQKGVMAELQKSVYKDVEVRGFLFVEVFCVCGNKFRIWCSDNQMKINGNTRVKVGVQERARACARVCLFCCVHGLCVFARFFYAGRASQPRRLGIRFWLANEPSSVSARGSLSVDVSILARCTPINISQRGQKTIFYTRASRETLRDHGMNALSPFSRFGRQFHTSFGSRSRTNDWLC